MRQYPIENNNWCGYCEDVTFGEYAWIDGVCDYDSITFRMTARHLLHNYSFRIFVCKTSMYRLHNVYALYGTGT